VSSPSTRLALTNPGGGTTDGTQQAIETTNGGASQRWSLTQVAGSSIYYNLKNVGSNKCLEPSSSGEGAAVVQDSCGGPDHVDEWSIEPQSDGTYLLKNHHSGYYLQSAGADASKVVQKANDSTNNIRRAWTFKATTPGLYWKKSTYTTPQGGANNKTLMCNQGDSVVFTNGQGPEGTPGTVALGNNAYAFTSPGTSAAFDITATTPAGIYRTDPGESGWPAVTFEFTAAYNAQVNFGILCKPGTNMTAYDKTQSVGVLPFQQWSEWIHCKPGFALNAIPDSSKTGIDDSLNIHQDSYTLDPEGGGRNGLHANEAGNIGVGGNEASQMKGHGTRYSADRWEGGLVTWVNDNFIGQTGVTTIHCTPGL
jgi:hypothetical protein